MGYAPFLFRQTNVPPSVEIPRNGDAKQTLPASSLRVAGHCCQGAAAFQSPELITAQTLAKQRLKNSHEYCCAVTGLFFADCSNERVCPLRGTSWDAVIDAWKHAERFGAVISLAKSPANNSHCQKRSVYCDRSGRARQTAR